MKVKREARATTEGEHLSADRRRFLKSACAPLLMAALGAVPAATPGRAADMRLRLALTTLCLYLDKHFKNSRESKLLTMTSVDQDMGSMEA